MGLEVFPNSKVSPDVFVFQRSRWKTEPTGCFYVCVYGTGSVSVTSLLIKTQKVNTMKDGHRMSHETDLVNDLMISLLK